MTQVVRQPSQQLLAAPPVVAADPRHVPGGEGGDLVLVQPLLVIRPRPVRPTRLPHWPAHRGGSEQEPLCCRPLCHADVKFGLGKLII